MRFDGDADGRRPGGPYEFWFQAGNTIYVDKVQRHDARRGRNGSLANPYQQSAAALAAADASPANPGVRQDASASSATAAPIATCSRLADNRPYLIGFKDQDAILDEPLADGGDFMVPQNVTVMIDAGANFKIRKANMNAGTTPQGLDFAQRRRDSSAGHARLRRCVHVVCRRYDGRRQRRPLRRRRKAATGAASCSATIPTAKPGRRLSELREPRLHDTTAAARSSSIRSKRFTPGPHGRRRGRTISYNTIQRCRRGHVGRSQQLRRRRPAPSDRLRQSPDRPRHPRQHRLGSPRHCHAEQHLNGLFVRIRTLAGNPIDLVDVPTRWDDTDIVHVVSENLLIAGTPGGSDIARRRPRPPRR